MNGKANSTPPHMSRLPWEQIEGPPADTGICLSGGGLRAASFSFGVLQGLQEKLGLVYGPTSAKYLTAVSGGSYIAATYALGARHHALHPEEYEVIPLLAEGSPEAAHVLSHGRYLARNWLVFANLGVLNFLALVALFVWAGTILADIAIIRPWVSEWLGEVFSTKVGELLSTIDSAPIILLVVAIAGIIRELIRCLFAEGVWRRRLLPLPLLVLLFALCRPVLIAAASYGNWWSSWSMVKVSATMVLALLLLAGVTWLAQKVGITGVIARGLNTLAAVGPRLFGFYLLAYSAVHWYRFLLEGLNNASETTIPAGVAFFSSLFGGLVFSYVPHRASLHREYRSRLRSCFGVRRNGDAATVIADPLLSELGTPMEDAFRFPRLIICATANVHVRKTGRGRFTFVPFVFSHDMCGVPGHLGAAFPTAKLELKREPAGVLTCRKEPLLSLFTAVAATGAAVAPSMGRYTVPSLRALIAAANIRLGRWFPNPFSVRAHKAVNNATADEGIWPSIWAWVRKDRRLGPGYNELVPEILGFDGPRVYVSDGGHYDNLGLLVLLGAKCAEIWCVDASPEPSGQAAEIRRVLAIARDEMRITADIDLNRFATTPQGFYPFTHAAGVITYPDGSTGRLVVVKLGLTRESPNFLRERRHKDRGFPHHSTFCKQVYSTDRMDAYRNLGYDSALRCLTDYAPNPS